MVHRWKVWAGSGLVAIGVASVTGCGLEGALLGPALLNTLSGDQVPFAPSPAAFVLIRGKNETSDRVEFIVTAEIDEPVRDNQGNYLVDETGQFIFRSKIETFQLPTEPGGQTSDLGVLVPCRQQIITRVGLGKNLLTTDIAALFGGEGTAAAPGFGIPASGINPLSAEEGNFTCGDTVIFRAVQSSSVTGNVVLQSFVMRGASQLPSNEFRGPHTFENYELFLESQVREDE